MHCQLSFLGYIKTKTWSWSAKSIEPQVRSDCTDVQACLALYWWQRLIIFGVGRIRVNFSKSNKRPWAHLQLSFKMFLLIWVFQIFIWQLDDNYCNLKYHSIINSIPKHIKEKTEYTKNWTKAKSFNKTLYNRQLNSEERLELNKSKNGRIVSKYQSSLAAYIFFAFKTTININVKLRKFQY